MEIRTEMDSLPTADGLMPAYVCRPADAGAHAAVIVVMEAFGLNAHIKDVAERIAREGYVTIAPDLFYRFGSPVVPYEDVPRALGYIQKFDDAALMAEVRRVDETLRRLKKTAEVKVYKGAGHGFFCNDRASYDAGAAQHAWDMMRQWLTKYLN